MKKLRLLAALLSVFLVSSAFAQDKALDESREVLSLIEKANDYWQAHNTPYCRAFWDNAAYFTGNMEAYRLTGKAEYYQFSDRWCRHNEWKGAKSNDKAKWRYKTYGEGDDFVLFGDWQICFQTYIDMYNLVPADYKVARAKEVMGYACNMQENKFWWWADALYMVMPVMTKMYRLTGDRMYLDKLYENFIWSDSLMWDKEAQLYYRDGKYIWPKVKTSCDGGKSFWARGDGWVLAGLAKVLADMPADYAHRDIFVQRFQQLAEGVARCQQAGGYWSRSMLCEADAPGPETSGTAFFCYGLEWGVNHGILDRTKYGPVIEKAWNYLCHVALQPDGSIGYVQPIGEKPDPTRIVDAHSQAPFGTGAWLLAACERVRYLNHTADYTPGVKPGAPLVSVQRAEGVKISVSNTTSQLRQEVIELDAQSLFDQLQIAGGRQLVVLDADGVEQPFQLTYDGKFLLQVFVRPGATSSFTVHVGQPKDYRLDCNGRVYPNREDDLAWENDRNAWRLYGLKLRGKGVAGFDAFTKNVPYPIQDQLYQNELNSYAYHGQLKKVGREGEWRQVHRDNVTYHRDHGQGMDAYTVGMTLGAGAPALMENGNLLLPEVYEKVEILDNGPLRFTARMTQYSQQGFTEVRLVSQDKGSHLAKCEVKYEGMQKMMQVCSGIAVHWTDPKSYVINRKAGYVAYAEAMDTPAGQNGQLFLACLYPQKMNALKYVPLPEEKSDAVGHVLGQTSLLPDDTFTYYFGTAWSKYDVPTLAVWETLLQGYACQLKAPLTVTVGQ